MLAPLAWAGHRQATNIPAGSFSSSSSVSFSFSFSSPFSCAAPYFVSLSICVVAPTRGPRGHNSLHDCTGRGHIGWKRGEVVPGTDHACCACAPRSIAHKAHTAYTQHEHLRRRHRICCVHNVYCTHRITAAHAAYSSKLHIREGCAHCRRPRKKQFCKHLIQIPTKNSSHRPH